jgi:phosphatidylserine decarboxylase
MDAMKSLLVMTPKSAVSFLTGTVARLKFPKFFQKQLNLAFVKGFGIDMSEAQLNIDDLQSIEDVFIRQLKPGSRHIAEGQVVASADGKLVKSLPVVNGLAIQAKGVEYSAADLVFGKSDVPSQFEPGWFQTIYLAPHNYHRVHSPVDGKITAIRHIPGKLWPVNDKFVNLIPQLFTTNERLVFDIETPAGAHAYVVMVGALNVGRIITKHCSTLVANDLGRQLGSTQRDVKFPSGGPVVKKGDELGIFMLGSTVVVIFDKKEPFINKLKKVDSTQSIQLGESLMS